MTRWHSAATSLVGAALLLLPGCGDASEAFGGASFDSATSSSDTVVTADAPTADGGNASDTQNAPDSGPPPADTTSDGVGPGDVAGPDAAGDSAEDSRSFTSKEADFFVPDGIAERADLALSASHAAWVERDAETDIARIVVVDLVAFGDPEPLSIPYLTNPRQLALGDGWLFYVDDRYGDADIFGVDLVDGVDVPIATNPGPQEHPSASGSRVVWQDCRECKPGLVDRPQIFLEDMVTGEAARLTDDDARHTRPVLGELDDGTTGNGSGNGDAVEGVAWVVDGRSLRTRAADGTVTAWPLPPEAPVSGVGLTDGYLAWRPSPVVINPDSMIPWDVFATVMATGAVVRLSTHSELRPGVDPTPVASGGRVAWLEDTRPSEPGLRQLQVYELAAQQVVHKVARQGMTAIALSSDWVGFIAPHPGNDGLPDVWIQAL